jgi:hypothetical protein
MKSAHQTMRSDDATTVRSDRTAKRHHRLEATRAIVSQFLP